MRVEAVLARTPVFQELGGEDLEALARLARLRRLAAGEVLFLEGDPVERLFVVARGAVRVFKMDPGGRRQLVLHVEGPYRVLAEVAVFLERPFYPASAEAMTPAVVVEVPRGAFYELVDRRPPVARALIRYLARRQGELVRLLDRVVFREVGARLAEYLLGRLEREGQGFVLPTNAELAAFLATVPEIVSRKLGQFYRAGWVRLEARRVWVVRPEALRELVGG
nr:Crp/Fnr family transcriptional regulator [Marinithermus hydrothermalis]